jgi:hypothetical protein
LFFKDIHARHDRTGSDRHLLDHIKELLLLKILCVTCHRTGAKHFRNSAAAFFKLPHFNEASGKNNGEGDADHPGKELRLKGVRDGFIDKKNSGNRGIKRGDDQEYRGNKEKNEETCLFPRFFLLSEKVHAFTYPHTVSPSIPAPNLPTRQFQAAFFPGGPLYLRPHRALKAR